MKRWLVILCLVVGCADRKPVSSHLRHANLRASWESNGFVLPDEGSALDYFSEPQEKEKEAAKDVLQLTPFTKTLLGVLTAINVWQMMQLYGHHRELGMLNAKWDRMASNTESEKRTRAYVNSLILSKLGFKDNEIKKAIEPDDPGDL